MRLRDTVDVLEATRCNVHENEVTATEGVLDFSSGQACGSLRPALSQLVSLFLGRVMQFGLVVRERTPGHSSAE